MSAPYVYDPRKPGFLNYPGEIRNIIYEMLLTNRYAHQKGTLKLMPLHPAILQCNRQIHNEAVTILQEGNIWIIVKVDIFHMRLLRTEHHIVRKEACNLKHPALRIEFTMPTAGVSNFDVTLIMGEESIEKFIRRLWLISTHIVMREHFRSSILRLFLYRTRFDTERKLLSTCLEPFALVYGIKHFTVWGPDSTIGLNVWNAFDRAESGWKLRMHIGGISQAYIDKGNRAYFAGRFTTAQDHYDYVLAYLNHRYSQKFYRRARRTESKAADIAAFRHWLTVVQCARVRVALALGNYKDVKSLGRTTLEFGPQSMPKQLRVQLMLCIARAHRALGEKGEELRVFMQALDAFRDESTFLTAMAELFPMAASEHKEFLNEQRGKLQRGEATGLIVILKFWETVSACG